MDAVGAIGAERHPGLVIKKSQFDLGPEQGSQGGVQLLLADQSLVEGFENIILQNAGTVQVDAGFNSCDGSCQGAAQDLMPFPDIVQRPAIRYYMPFELPFVSLNMMQEGRTWAARLPVHPVVGAHDRFYMGVH